MTSRRCERCGNRVRVRSRRCRHCNWKAPAVDRRGSRRRLAALVGALAVSVVAALFVGRQLVEPDTIADWYAEFAMQHLPRQFSSVGPAESASGAFYFCIRRVVRDGIERESVATFPVQTAENTTSIGDGRYRVSTHVIEERVDGASERKPFTCIAEYERNRWVLHELEMGTHAAAEAPFGTM
jgi:hypothetical protein